MFYLVPAKFVTYGFAASAHGMDSYQNILNNSGLLVPEIETTQKHGLKFKPIAPMRIRQGEDIASRKLADGGRLGWNPG